MSGTEAATVLGEGPAGPGHRTGPDPAGRGTAPTGRGTGTTVLGYPRIGPRRELKRALESYWAGRSTSVELTTTGRELREATWRRLTGLGLDRLPSNTFSFYDHVLDTAVWLGAVPERYRVLGHDDPDSLDPYFAMARGHGELAPLPMTKWFGTNYHHLVPELGPDTPLGPDGARPGERAKPVAEFVEAAGLGLVTRPVLLGPVTFLLVARATAGAPAGFRPLDRLDDVLAGYAEVLGRLAAAGAPWVQLDEPALVTDLSLTELAAVDRAYRWLADLADRPRLLVASPYGHLGAVLPVLADTPVDGLALDLVRGAADLVPSSPGGRALWGGALAGRTLVAGVVAGDTVWRTDRERALAVLAGLRDRAGEVLVGTSCSLLHVPVDLDREPELDPGLRARLAFADQKVAEVVSLAQALDAMPEASAARRFPAPVEPAPAEPGVARGEPFPVPSRGAYPVRAAQQARRLGLPVLPLTTIGSFPQTERVRAVRTALREGTVTGAEYERRIRAEIEDVVRLQERLGLDLLVHGEPERNDMVQYFAEQLDGFAVTRHGWVQSYGSRCTRPPILHGDVARPEPITLRWIRYAQSLTSLPVKGILTGPVTMVAWSFVREDLPLREVLHQVALAVREEVRDLDAAGVPVVQVDEPALRELMPLRREHQAEYLDLAVAAYRLATSAASDSTQVHTHLCYSRLGEILDAIDALDADVTSIESARSGATVLDEPALARFGRGLGPGVYDIHSPRIPGRAEVEDLLRAALRVLPAERVWVNPDCGLKTRTSDQVTTALTAVVAATRRLRAELTGPGAVPLPEPGDGAQQSSSQPARSSWSVST